MKEFFKYALLGAILIVCLYLAFSKSQKFKDIRQASKTLQQQTDSLKVIVKSYAKLQQKYEHIYEEMSSSRNNIYQLKNRIDSLLKLKISDADKLNDALNNIIGDLHIIPPVFGADTTNANFRFDL